MKATINCEEVVRAKGDYVVGRKGVITAVDLDKNRAQVAWYGETKTWVSFDSIEPTSTPYVIIPGHIHPTKGTYVFAKYRAI